MSSHLRLHPEHGGRFVLERVEEAPLRYAVVVYLPGEARLEGVVAWDGERAALTPTWDDAWATATALKLARVVKRTAQPKLVRWRARDDEASAGT